MTTITQALSIQPKPRHLQIQRPAPPPPRKLPLWVVACNEQQVARLCVTLRLQRSQIRSYNETNELECIDRLDRPLYVLPGAVNNTVAKGQAIAFFKSYRGGEVVYVSENQLFRKEPFPRE